MEIDLDQSTQQIVRCILEASGCNAGVVARHVVGAALQMRFADSSIEVESHRHSSTNEEPGWLGDFLVNDTVFHVTMSPMSLLVQACASNVAAGYTPYLLVPASQVTTALDLATAQGILRQMVIMSIEQFVGQMLDFMSAFSQPILGASIQRLIETYNARVQAGEKDSTLLLGISASSGQVGPVLRDA